MDRAGRVLLIAAVAIAVVAGVVVAVVVLGNGTGPGTRPTNGFTSQPGGTGAIPQDLVSIDSEPGQHFPGGLIKLSQAQGGKWLLVYQVIVDGTPTVFARESADLLRGWSEPVQVSSSDMRSFDPGAVQLDDGSVMVEWEAKPGFWYSMRQSDGSYTEPKLLFQDSGGGAFESTVTRLHGHAYMLYNFHPDSRPLYLWDVRMRQILNGPTVAEPVTVATNGPGFGSQGAQKRVTASETGAPEGILVVWNHHTEPVCSIRPTPGLAQKVCGPRPIFGALSEDGGKTFGQPFQVAAMPGHDLVNPFAILVAPDDLRVYFSVDRHIPLEGYVQSTDHGHTWSEIKPVWFPRQIRPARVVIVDTPQHGLVAIVGTIEFRVLGAFPLDKATKENALRE